MESARAARNRTRGPRGEADLPPHHDERPLSFEDEISRAIERGGISNWHVDWVRLHERNFGRLFCRNVLRQFEMHWPQSFLLRKTKGFTHGRGNCRWADNLPRHLRQRRHGRDDIYDLEAPLFAAKNPLLACDHDHRHRSQQGIGGARGQVQRPRTKRCKADARPASQPSLRGRHERGGLLMARHNELDAGPAERLDDIEILFTGYAEDPLDAFILQSSDKQVRTLHAPAS
jgi:hypothetical protein